MSAFVKEKSQPTKARLHQIERINEERKQLRVLEQYRGLVLKLAWEYWKKLPASVKVWVDPDDLIEEAYLYVIRHEAKGDFDPTRARKSTFLWTGISSILMNFALAQQTQKRFGWRVSLDELLFIGRRDREIDKLEARESLRCTFEAASPGLRREMLKWFGQQKPKIPWSKEAMKMYQEFRLLADKYRLSAEDCRQLMRSDLWVE
jgi:hypothetical protein